jgi:hypothetical protein
MSAVDLPEGLDGEVFGCRSIAHNAKNPAVNRGLLFAEYRFKSIRIALPKPVQYVL